MDRRTQIMQAAFAQMAESGLESVHARTVAQRLRINHATVHYYFRSREDLLGGVAEYARIQLALDRQHLGKPSDAREGVENEIALIESYASPSSKMGAVILGLCAAQKGEPGLAEGFRALAYELLNPIEEACQKAKTRKSSPFGEGKLISEILLGAMIKAHLTGDGSGTEELLDEVHSLLFKS